jgi:hypothetical protein
MSPRRKREKKAAGGGANGTTTSSTPAKKISRDDIEAKLNELRGEVDEGIDAARGIGIAVAVGGAVLLVLTAYWMGRRRDRKRKTVLEIRRI